MNTLITAFIEHHVSQLTVSREYQGLIAKYFEPLRLYPVQAITPLIVERWFHEIGKDSQVQANKCLSILRTMFEKAHDWELYNGNNPAGRVKKYARNERDRFVQPDEMPRLMHVLQGQDNDIQCFFLLCLLVGCRRSEALRLKWSDLNIQEGLWHKCTTKTRFKHTVPIPASLMARIAAIPKVNEWVFASPRSTYKYQQTRDAHWSKGFVFYHWKDIRRAAQLPDVTIHDLRRTCASWLAIHGENMAVIGKGVLNHTSLANTGIYARLNVSPVSKALEANSARMLGPSPSSV